MKIKKLFVIVVVVILIASLIWAIFIIPRQLGFSNMCEKMCLSFNKSYDTHYLSIPFTSRINGECYCTTKELYVKTKYYTRKE
jgi:hypothetical protein